MRGHESGRDVDPGLNRAIETRIDVAASNAFGFGGVNTCLVFRRVPA